MKALHFGAGNIGRGFIGKLLADANIHVIFADVNQEVINKINQDKQYDVRIVDESIDTIEVVSDISAINSSDLTQTNQAIASVDLLTTAVGPNVLKLIAPAIAQGILQRLKVNQQPLNIIACENMVQATAFLKDEIMSHIPSSQQAEVESNIGFINSAVDRIVPQVPPKQDNPLLVTVEQFSEWIVDQTQFKGNIPDISGMQLTDNLLAFIERKLFTLNTGHAATAYFGKLKGINLIKDAIQDTTIKNQVKQTMQESGHVLTQRFNFDPVAHKKYIEKILSRFANPYLDDDVDRVGRQPIRKLSPNERLVKPLLGTIEYHSDNTFLIRTIAAALLYENNNDPQAVELHNYMNENSVKQAITYYTKLENNAIIERIIAEYNNLSGE